jgi:hypothetical protein
LHKLAFKKAAQCVLAGMKDSTSSSMQPEELHQVIATALYTLRSVPYICLLPTQGRHICNFGIHIPRPGSSLHPSLHPTVEKQNAQ